MARIRTIQDAVDVLNEINRLDPKALAVLVQHRVFCNDALAAHESVQVGKHDGVLKVGLLGIINGIFGSGEEFGPIVAEMADDGLITKFYWANKEGEPK